MICRVDVHVGTVVVVVYRKVLCARYGLSNVCSTHDVAPNFSDVFRSMTGICVLDARLFGGIHSKIHSKIHHK